ncbi:MAG: hypothetical protein AMXMBFR82_44350 [Candidatus Hydrogenedentota bacterium]
MHNQRIDIDKHRWMAVRDGIFIYVKTYRRWSMDIVVAPVERVSVLRRSALPVIRSIPFVSYAALFGAPVFAICALVMLGTHRDAPLYALGMAVVCSLALTTVFAVAMLLFGRIKGRRETLLYVSGNVYSPMIRFKHTEGGNPTLEAFLDTLPAGSAASPGNVPLGEWYRLPSRARSVLVSLYWPMYTYVFWPRQPIEGEISNMLAWGVVVLLLGGYLVFLGLLLWFYFRNPRATKEARAALFDGDYDAGATILRGVIEKTPGQPYANYLLLAESLVRGDLEHAATCADVVEKSRIRQFVAPPVFGITVHSPVAEKLRDLERYQREKRSGNDSAETAESGTAITPLSQT